MLTKFTHIIILLVYLEPYKLSLQKNRGKNVYTVDVRNPNTFGFQTEPHRSFVNLFEHKKAPKSERFVQISDVRLVDRACSNVPISDIRAFLNNERQNTNDIGRSNGSNVRNPNV